MSELDDMSPRDPFITGQLWLDVSVLMGDAQEVKVNFCVSDMNEVSSLSTKRKWYIYV